MPVSLGRQTVVLFILTAISGLQSALGGQPVVPTRQLAHSPPRQPTNSPTRRLIEIEIGVSGQAAALSMQRWSQRLAELKVDRIQIRQARPDDEVAISEEAFGRQSLVRVFGMLDPRGRLVVPGHAFSSQDVGRLSDWLDELREYGPKGSPQGKPSWGLSEKQLESLRDALAKPASASEQDDSLAKVIERCRRATGLDFVAETPDDTSGQEDTAQEASLPTDTRGLSWGTWMAYVLDRNGLALEPERTPGDTVRLRIAPRERVANSWPVGWPPAVRNVKLVPRLFEFVTVDLQNVTAAELVVALEARLEVPILIDLPGLEQAGIDPAGVRVSFGPTRGAWITNLRKILFQAKLKNEVRIDEAGTPFVWITTLKAPDESVTR